MKGLLIVCCALVLAVGCTKDKPNVELIQDMMESPAVKAQDYDLKRPGEMANRIPPTGTQSIGNIPYKFKGKAEEAEKALQNPFAGASAGKTLDRGKELFETYCYVCHGFQGDGKGPVAPKFQVPIPTLLSDKVKNFKDGRIFHIIVDGQGLMGSYASQVKSDSDRWAIVNYVRSLQRK